MPDEPEAGPDDSLDKDEADPDTESADDSEPGANAEETGPGPEEETGTSEEEPGEEEESEPAAEEEGEPGEEEEAEPAAEEEEESEADSGEETETSEEDEPGDEEETEAGGEEDEEPDEEDAAEPANAEESDGDPGDTEETLVAASDAADSEMDTSDVGEPKPSCPGHLEVAFAVPADFIPPPAPGPGNPPPPPVPGNLRVHVTDSSDNSDVDGATVTISGGDSATGSTTTEPEGKGRKTFRGVKTGPYTITVSKSGYLTGTGTATVNPAATTDAEIRLVPCKPIATIKIISIEFTSDHGVLKDYTADWEDGGTVFPKPQWTPADQRPMSHTMDKPVEMQVKIEVGPPDACPGTGSLRGEGPNGMVFETARRTFSAGPDTISMKSDRNLDKKIQELDFTINWSTLGIGGTVSPSQTKNTMFVTMGDPTTPRTPGITLKRMRQAVKATGRAGSLDPHVIVRSVMSKWGNFNLDVQFQNEWKLADDARFPAGHPRAGQLVGADCQTIVRHVESVIKMVGCPGTTEIKLIWAKPSAPTAAIENDFGGPDLNHPNITHPSEPWFAFLKDGDGNANAFEACLKFTQGGKTVYYAGGVGPKNNKDEVLRVFVSLSWFRQDAGGRMVEAAVIHTY